MTWIFVENDLRNIVLENQLGRSSLPKCKDAERTANTPEKTSLHMAVVQAFDAQFLGCQTSTPASFFLSQLSTTISQRMSTADLLFGDCFNPIIVRAAICFHCVEGIESSKLEKCLRRPCRRTRQSSALLTFNSYSIAHSKCVNWSSPTSKMAGGADQGHYFSWWIANQTVIINR